VATFTSRDGSADTVSLVVSLDGEPCAFTPLHAKVQARACFVDQTSSKADERQTNGLSPSQLNQSAKKGQLRQTRPGSFDVRGTTELSLSCPTLDLAFHRRDGLTEFASTQAKATLTVALLTVRA